MAKIEETFAQVHELFHEPIDTHIFASTFGVSWLRSKLPTIQRESHECFSVIGWRPTSLMGMEILQDASVPDEEIQIGRLVYEDVDGERKPFKVVTQRIGII